MPHPQREQLLRQADEHERAGQFQEAADVYDALLVADNTDVEAICRFGVLALDVDQPEPAIQLFTQALSLRPELTEARSNLGVALARVGKTREAVDAWLEVLKRQPNDIAASANVGRAFLQELNRPDFAVPHLAKWVAGQADDADALTMLGEANRRIGRLDDASDAFERVVRIKPTADNLGVLGFTQVQAGLPAEGIATLRKAVALDPSRLATRSDLLVALHYDPALDPKQLFEEHLTWANAVAHSHSAHANARDPDRRLRIGYVSGDFRRHAAESFIRPVLAAHDRDAFDIVCYSTYPGKDDATARFQAMADTWHDVAPLDDDELARLIRADRIDILVDLSGHTAGNRLTVFARKPAPVQVTWLGYWNTTGLLEVDYRITDAVADPPGEPRRHTEELIRLPGGFSCFAPPDDLPPLPTEPPCVRNGYVTFGSMHSVAKLNDDVLDLWADLLSATPNSRLLVCRHELTGRVRERLLDRLVAQGIGVDRAELRSDLPAGGEWLTVYNDMDVALDVVPWSGHTTACEALFMGVPVVTLAGNAHAGRMVASVLTHAGLGQWVAGSPSDYVKIARSLAGDVDQLRRYRQSLRTQVQQSCLTDGKSAARELERAYRQMWRMWCAEGGQAR